MGIEKRPASVALEDYVSLFLRPFFKGRISPEFISQDFFASMADLRYGADGFDRIPEPTHHSAYVNSEHFESFLETDWVQRSLRVLMVGNSDRDFVMPLSLPTGVQKAFLQNLCMEQEGLELLPIGVENLSYAKAGLPLFMRPGKHKISKVLVGPFGKTHSERKELLSAADAAGSHLTIVDKRMTTLSYARLSGNHQFVACPRGNGMDTHRFWETLYRGSIPIVKRSAWSQSAKKLNLPFLEVEDWAELNDLDLDRIDRTRLGTLDALSPDYWRERILGLS